MSKITELASGQINSTHSLKIEFVEAEETPALVIIRWPDNATVVHPHRFPSAADRAARIFATAAVRLASIKRERKL
jgi:hypothetical protein